MFEKPIIINNKYDIFYVLYANKVYPCKLKGNIKYKKSDVCVGDNVVFDQINNLITDVLDRKNSFIRPRIANIDRIIIVMSIIEPEFDFLLLSKYLMKFESHMIHDIVICLSKTDLVSKDEVKLLKNEIELGNYMVKDTNNPNDLLWLKNNFKDKISCLVGQTGVGKTTLINKLTNLDLKTQPISIALNRGKHTTSFVQLISFCDGFIADSPGFSSFDLDMDKYQYAKSFLEFYYASTRCQFNDCLHINEKNCEIKDLVKNNKICQWKYDNYLKIIEKDNKNAKEN